MNEIVSNIKCVFAQHETDDTFEYKTNATVLTQSEKRKAENMLADIKYFLTMLGMNGEKGSGDILKICEYLLRNETTYSRENIEHIAQDCGDSVKNVEQRVRRAIKKGLSNAANAGIEDYSGDVFQIYASYVFDFTNLTEEMNYHKGLALTGGRINIAKFIEGLIFYSESCEKE